MTLEAAFRSVPVLTFVGHLSLINPDVFTARVTVFREHSLETHTAIWPPFLHDVALTPKLSITFKATEVLHVPAPPFSLCALISKYNLITSPTARLYQLRMVSPTVQELVFEEVDQVDQ